MFARFFLVFSIATATACSSDPEPPSTALDSGVDASKDTATVDTTVPGTDTTMSTDCGGKTCAADEVCIASTCQCAASKTYCGSGCVDTSTSALHCGGCERPCAGSEMCSDGKCVAPCPVGQTRCAGKCVSTMTDSSNCGTCGKSCTGAETCMAGTCGTVCEFPNKTCGGKCVNVQFDAANCGDCGKVCPTGAKGTANCTSGSCVLTCEANFGNCDDISTNGCEVALSSTDAHCGGCFKSCTSTETCLASKCECKMGTARCGASCVDVTSSDANCGLCGKACTSTESCKSSTCDCKTGLTRCSGTCLDTKTDAANCGACGTACAAGKTCSDGVCCPTGQLNCGGTCFDPTNSPAHCGSCATSCSGATPYCVTSACSATCASGSVVCSGKCTNTATDATNCGMCGKACLSTEVCSAGACIAAGFPGSTVVDVTQGQKINTWAGTTGQLWKLCYSKDTSAATSAAFHANCDAKGPSVTIARLVTATTTRIVGGYTGVAWSTLGSWKPDPTAFLFSITNDYKHPLISATGASAVYHSSSYGPTFGGGHDWYVASTMNSGYCYFGSTYACRAGFTSTACQNDFCGTYNTWTVAALEVWVK